MGKRMHKPDIVTPAGIRQKYRLHGTTPGHLKWSGIAIRGLTYMMTDKGPQAYHTSRGSGSSRGNGALTGTFIWRPISI